MRDSDLLYLGFCLVGFYYTHSYVGGAKIRGVCVAYVDMLACFAGRRTLSLREMQSVAGRMQRAVLTLPPPGLRVSWQIFLV